MESRSAESQAEWLERNAVDSLPGGALNEKLALGRPLRVKLGIDPTAPDIHLGHTVVLGKLREFQVYNNAARCRASLAGHTLLTFAGGGQRGSSRFEPRALDLPL